MTIRLEKDIDWSKASDVVVLDGARKGSPGAKREWARRRTPGLEADLANWNPADHPRNPANGRFIEKGALVKALLRRFSEDDTPLPGLPAKNRRLRSATPEVATNPPFVFSGTEVRRDDALMQVGLASGWPHQDAAGGDGSVDFERSVIEQRSAQIAAGVWLQEVDPFSPIEDQWAATLYSEYQMPEEYQRINAALRTGEPNDYYGDPEMVRESVNRMFEKAGWNVEAPMTTYRAYKSLPHTGDWARTLKPGTTMHDKGILSTTTHRRFSQGWLMRGIAGKKGRSPSTDDVVMEIKVPVGQRIVGGNVQFIETMLPPDTPLKIVSSEVRTADAVNPLDSGEFGKFEYTHVVAEVIRNA